MNTLQSTIDMMTQSLSNVIFQAFSQALSGAGPFSNVKEVFEEGPKAVKTVPKAKRAYKKRDVMAGVIIPAHLVRGAQKPILTLVPPAPVETIPEPVVAQSEPTPVVPVAPHSTEVLKETVTLFVSVDPEDDFFTCTVNGKLFRASRKRDLKARVSKAGYVVDAVVDAQPVQGQVAA